MLRGWVALLVAGSLLATGCASKKPRSLASTWQPPEVQYPVQEGVASWYGPGFHGRLTSSREIFDQYGFTAAHRTLPLGTWALVTNKENGRTVKVYVNDRGPYINGRVIDLSYAAAAAIDMVHDGTAPVRIVILGPLPPTERTAARFGVR